MQTHVNRGLAWIGAASSFVGLLDVVATFLILNLWVDYRDLGIATKAVWLFPILDQATDLGLSAAVIQRDDHSESRISTVFWINVALGTLLFLVVAGVAPLLASFSGHAIVGWMLVAYSTKLLFQNIYGIPSTLMKRELRFKELSVIRILANIAEFTGKVGFAAAGFSIWCFVLGPLCRIVVTAVGVQLRHPWRPKMIANLRDAREYISFGLKASGSQILFYFYTNVDYPIVGYFFGDVALGLYRLAYEIVLEPVRIISNVVVDVAFPAFAKLRHAPERLSAQLVSFTKLNLIAVMLFSAVVFVAATELITTIVPKWATIYELHIATWTFTPLPSGVDLGIRILVAVAVLRSLSFVLPPLLDGVGRPDRTFAYMSTAAIALPILFITSAIVLGPSLGWQSVAVGWAVGYPIAFAVLVYLAIHTLRWSTIAYLRSIAGVAMCMLLAGVVAWGVHYALGAVPGGVRLAVTAIVVVLVAGLLLAYTQGLSLRTATRALKGDADSEAA